MCRHADAAGGTVLIAAADGTVKWRYEWQRPQICWHLPHGNLLFCHATGVIETTYGKKIVLAYHAPSRAEVHARRPLPDGQVMPVGCRSCRIVEID